MTWIPRRKMCQCLQNPPDPAPASNRRDGMLGPAGALSKARGQEKNTVMEKK